MYSRIKSAVCQGLISGSIEIETHISSGLPHHSIVGLPNAVIKESKERVRAALASSGIPYPDDHITQSLVPAFEKKEGSQLDLPLAVGIYCAVSGASVGDAVFLGELSLEGRIKSFANIENMLLSAEKGSYFVLPYESRDEIASMELHDVGLGFYDDLKALVKDIDAGVFGKITAACSEKSAVSEDRILDFCDVRGQAEAVRLLQIAAAGGFHVLINGPPGCGKSMMASRFAGIMPEPDRQQNIEICKVHGAKMRHRRPVRTPHHSITPMALIGGGASMNLGEISKAHGGVLVLDELGEYKKEVLELLREPLETGSINLSRASKSIVLPADFQLIATMNPCICGGYVPGRRSFGCTCSKLALERYYSKLSWPLIDRMGLYIHVDKVHSGAAAAKSTERLRSEVAAARSFGLEHGGYSERTSAATMKKFDSLFDKCMLSQRARGIILRVAEHIANLESSREVSFAHMVEAIQANPSYRLMDLRR